MPHARLRLILPNIDDGDRALLAAVRRDRHQQRDARRAARSCSRENAGLAAAAARAPARRGLGRRRPARWLPGRVLSRVCRLPRVLRRDAGDLHGEPAAARRGGVAPRGAPQSAASCPRCTRRTSAPTPPSARSSTWRRRGRIQKLRAVTAFTQVLQEVRSREESLQAALAAEAAAKEQTAQTAAAGAALAASAASVKAVELPPPPDDEESARAARRGHQAGDVDERREARLRNLGAATSVSRPELLSSMSSRDGFASPHASVSRPELLSSLSRADHASELGAIAEISLLIPAGAAIPPPPGSPYTSVRIEAREADELYLITVKCAIKMRYLQLVPLAPTRPASAPGGSVCASAPAPDLGRHSFCCVAANHRRSSVASSSVHVARPRRTTSRSRTSRRGAPCRSVRRLAQRPAPPPAVAANSCRRPRGVLVRQLADFEQKLSSSSFCAFHASASNCVERRGGDRKREHASAQHRPSKKSAEV